MHTQAAELRKSEQQLTRVKEDVRLALEERQRLEKYIDWKKEEVVRLQHQVDTQRAKVENLRKGEEGTKNQGAEGPSEPPGWGMLTKAFKESKKG
eukprot:851337-Lingulodinium_polyedra.AAC.1